MGVWLQPDSSVITSDEQWRHNQVYGCLFCAEHGAEDITVLRDGLAFLSTVRTDSQRPSVISDKTALAICSPSRG